MTEKILMAAVARAKSGNKEQCRAEFEAWARSEGHSPILYGIGEDAEYDMPEHYLFAGWRAAWNRRAAQPVVLSDEHPFFQLFLCTLGALALYDQKSAEEYGAKARAILAAKE